ncbi:hypothetical protein [Catenuloplanes japonicus]|uniref:hypothetical protein n=1 Tax=Catenuloplanes japonicus TaxID=33876 RepID=UPI000A5D44AC|nr:hypothetical protein [Catenuloplanes japonicus]
MLTAREQEIAEPAAVGPAGRGIGAHLSQVFPKCGPRSRAGLRDALLRLTD